MFALVDMARTVCYDNYVGLQVRAEKDMNKYGEGESDVAGFVHNCTMLQ